MLTCKLELEKKNNVPGMKTFHTLNWSLPKMCEWLLQSSGASLVNKCTCVFPGVTMTDFMTVVEDNTVSQL